VERNESELAYLADIREALTAEAVSMIDFDRLRIWLDQLAVDLPILHRDRDEATVLREDYQNRIGGMLKAIAVAERGRPALGDALEIIDNLPARSATELIDCYRRTSARFRDTFPTSFGLITQRRAPENSNTHMTKRA
jgi:hypothetical protein